MNINKNNLIKIFQNNFSIIILSVLLLISFIYLNIDEDKKLSILSFIYNNLIIVEFVGLILIITNIRKSYKNIIVAILVLTLVLSSTYLEYIGVYNIEYFEIIETSYIAIIIAYIDWEN